MTLFELAENLESYGFQCAGGPLENAVDWMTIKDALQNLSPQRSRVGIAAPASSVPPSASLEWRCFHCGMVFTDEQAAREHFGRTRHDIRACDALSHPAVKALKFQHWHVIKGWRDALSDLVDACYTEGSSPSWRLCGVCEMEHHREATLGDQTHVNGCAVEEAEKVLRALLRQPSPETPQEPKEPVEALPRTQAEIIERFQWAASRMSPEQIHAALPLSAGPAPAEPTEHSRLRVLIKRIDRWEGVEDGTASDTIAEELLLDIKQCLESIVAASPPQTTETP